MDPSSRWIQAPGSLDRDWQIRLAAFAALGMLTEPTGGVISRDQITAGFTFAGDRIPFALRARGIWKPRQLAESGAALSLTTVAVKEGATPRYDDQVASLEQDFIEYAYQGTNPENADNRAARRAYELRRPVIYFYGLVPGVFEAIFPAYIDADDPTRLKFRVVADAVSLSSGMLAEGGSPAPLKAYATRTVKQRLHQHRFRQLVVAAYRTRCAMCRLGHDELLDAAHILPDRDERGRPEVPNGLSLCKIHHGAYDASILGVDPDHRIHVRQDILDEHDGPILQYGLQRMEGGRLTLPTARRDHPNRDYLAERFERFRAA